MIKTIMKHGLLFISAILVIGGSLNSVSTAAAFNQNKIISDVVFDNTNTMNPGQIDAFLNTFPNSCISPNSGFAALDPTGYNPTSGYQYGGFVSAGKAIYDAAQAYGINPQVLVTTLEKEQSLVTGRNNFSGYCNNGDQHKYAAAVGYGCPDSGTIYDYTLLNLYSRNGTVVSSTGTTCVNSSSKAGFTQQVVRAAWLLKFGEQRSEGKIGWAVIKGNWNNSDDPQTCYGGPMTQGNLQRCPSGGSTYYDGYTTIDNTAVHMDSGATAALYWYTPHFHGNQIFFDLFNSWFGSPYNSGQAYTWTIDSQEAYSDSSYMTSYTDGITARPGSKIYLRIKARNYGYQTWTANSVHLGTSHQQDRVSRFADTSWLSSNRITMLEPSVLPGDSATFQFTMTAPATTGSYSEYFNLLADGISWMNDLGLYYPIDVVEPKVASNTESTGLAANATLSKGQNLLSPDTQSTLNFQGDGNIVLYSNSKPVWASSIGNSKATKLVMQGDGNLVEYDSTGMAVWASSTSGNPGAYLTMQTDGNLVIYNANGVAVWATYTLSNPDHLSRVNRTLPPATNLYPGQSLTTADRRFRFTVQKDGNLVVYSATRAIWSSGTVGKAVSLLSMQSDGNLVLYGSSGQPIWYSGTAGRGGASLSMQSDGNLVLYAADGRASWASNTAGVQ